MRDGPNPDEEIVCMFVCLSICVCVGGERGPSVFVVLLSMESSPVQRGKLKRATSQFSGLVVFISALHIKKSYLTK